MPPAAASLRPHRARRLSSLVREMDWPPLLLRLAVVAAGGLILLLDPSASLHPLAARDHVSPLSSALALAGFALPGLLMAFGRRVTILGSPLNEVVLPFDLIVISLLVRSTSPEASVFYFYFPLALIWASLGMGAWRGTVAGTIAAGVFAIVAGPSVAPGPVVYGTLLLPLIGAVCGGAQWSRRRQLREQMQRAQEALDRLRRMQQAHAAVAAMAPLQLPARVDGFLDLAVDLARGDVAAAALLDEDGAPVVRGVRALDRRDWVGRRLPAAEGVAAEVLREGEPVVTADAASDPAWAALLDGAGVRAAAALPLRIRGRPIGFGLVGRRDVGRFRPEELESLLLLADEAAVMLHDGQVQEQLRELLSSSVRSLVAALEAKDPHTRGHSERVSALAVAIATELGLPPDEVERIRLAGLFHDLGKIATPEEILRKAGPLTAGERAVVHEHAERGAAILAEMRPFRAIAELVLSHQESYDGSGYPQRLAGEAIPLGARIIRAADAFDAIVSDRPYRRGKPLARAVAELRRMAGSDLDPAVVDAFLRVLATKPPFAVQLRMAREHA